MIKIVFIIRKHVPVRVVLQMKASDSNIYCLGRKISAELLELSYCMPN